MNNLKKNWRKLSFSQQGSIVITVFAMIGVVLSYILPFLSLALFGEAVDGNATIAVALIGSIIAVSLTYALYNGGLKKSRNKYGIDRDGIPYSLKQKYEEIFECPSVDDEEEPVTESYDPDSIDD